jgi:DHA2 family multidrug resistance protein
VSTLAARQLAAAAAAPGEISMREKIVAFAAMCVGFFIALLDIQIVSASLADTGTSKLVR